MQVERISSVEQLREEYDDPYVRWQVDPEAMRVAYRRDDAVVVENSHDRHGRAMTRPFLICLGKPDDLRVLLAQLQAELAQVPGRVSIEAHAVDAMPTAWRYAGSRTWDFMWTNTEPSAHPGEDAVEVLQDLDEVDSLLDRANPDTHGRPGDRGNRCWVGVHDGGGELVAVGGLFVVGSRTPHLRGITTMPDALGLGYATAISTRLTRIGLADFGPVVTLGVYTDNRRAIGIYERLGFRHAHTFVSGDLSPAVA